MKQYLDIKTIKVSNLVAEYMLKLFFSKSTSHHIKKEVIRIVELDKLVNEYLKEISCDELKDYVIEINKRTKSIPCFAFVSNKYIGEPLRLYLTSYTECCS